MRHLAAIAVLMLVLTLGGLPGGAGAAAGGDPASGEGFRILVLHETEAFRHASVDNVGLGALDALGAANGFAVDDARYSDGLFTDENLARYAAIVFLTNGNVLDDDEQAAFQRYIRAGGGWMGIHGAANSERDWPWFEGLMGSYFSRHPAGDIQFQEGTIKVDDRAHPATAHLPRRWTWVEEWYDFTSNPRGDVHVLVTVDETTYEDAQTGLDHPLAWCHDYDGGRSFYTALGHLDEAWSKPEFLLHLLGGIQSVAGVVPADCGATIDDNYVKTPIDTDTRKPIRLEVAPDGRLFYLEQLGQVRIYKPDTGEVVTAADFRADHSILYEFHNRSDGFANGLIGLAFDPDFETNQWLYLYYTPGESTPCPPTEADSAVCGELVVSRFTMNGDTLDLSSEQVLLRIGHQRDICCHSAGDIAFDRHGNLYIATGDDTNPHQSSGYAPIDERDGRNVYDAQRTAANTNDLRGKILRIHPETDGTYTVPEGNLFEPGTPLTRPEIYAMGFRNPFTISVDPETDAVVVAEFGPDAAAASTFRGPEGRTELNHVAQPGNYGWPYCISNNTPYMDYDFALPSVNAILLGWVAVAIEPFDCDSPVNDSPNNTGLTELPPAQPSTLYSSINAANAPTDHALGYGSAPMAGTFLEGSATGGDSGGLPGYFDDVQLWTDWNRGELYELLRDDDRSPQTINRFLATFAFRRPISVVQGTSGELYVSEWGLESFYGPNTDSGVYRITYQG